MNTEGNSMKKRAFKRTSLRLEQDFWKKLDSCAAASGQRWQELVNSLLLDKPPSVSRASWLRCAMVD